MDNLIPILYREYGQYSNQFRALPLDIDGLKPVERRVLLSAYQIARSNFVKSVRVDGHVVGHYHPHSLCYGTIVQLVNQGFLDGQGSFGSKAGAEPCGAAASRYTECRLSKKTFDLAFKYIDYVNWFESELDNEPEFIPTMFPFCLIGTDYTVGIGFGYRTFIPCYHVKDLHQRLLFLLKKIDKEPIIEPITDCKILASKEDLKTLLTTGKSSISVKGIFKEDNVKCKITLKSFPPGRKFEFLLSKFSKELENQDIGWDDLSSQKTEIIFEVLKQRNRDSIFKTFLKKFDSAVVGNINFEIVVVDKNGKVQNMSVDNMLIKTYQNYVEVNKVMLNVEIKKIQESIDENLILEKIRPSLAKNIQNKTGVINPDEVVDKINLETKVDKDKIKMLLSKYRITKLLTLKTDISELEKIEKDLKNKLKNIQEFVLSQYNDFVGEKNV